MEEVKINEAERMKKHVTVVGAVRIGVSSLGLFLSLGMYVLFSNLMDFLPKEEVPEFVVNFMNYLFMILPIVMIYSVGCCGCGVMGRPSSYQHFSASRNALGVI